MRLPFHVFTFRYAFSCFRALFGSRLPSPFPLPRRSSAPLFASKWPTSCTAPLTNPLQTELQSTFCAQHLFFFIKVLLVLQKAETLKIKREDYCTLSHLFKIKPDNFCSKLHGFSQKQVDFQNYSHYLSCTSLFFK